MDILSAVKKNKENKKQKNIAYDSMDSNNEFMHPIVFDNLLAGFGVDKEDRDDYFFLFKPSQWDGIIKYYEGLK